MAATIPHWTKTSTETSTGYELAGHRLVKSGRRWRLFVDDGREYDLGTRASFDTAEMLIGA